MRKNFFWKRARSPAASHIWLNRARCLPWNARAANPRASGMPPRLIGKQVPSIANAANFGQTVPGPQGAHTSSHRGQSPRLMCIGGSPARRAVAGLEKPYHLCGIRRMPKTPVHARPQKVPKHFLRSGRSLGGGRSAAGERAREIVRPGRSVRLARRSYI